MLHKEKLKFGFYLNGVINYMQMIPYFTPVTLELLIALHCRIKFALYCIQLNLHDKIARLSITLQD